MSFMTLEEKKKILVVDDEVNWLTTIRNVLEADYALTLKADPSEALEALKENAFSLVILDMKFRDGVQGSEIFQQMQQVSPDLRAIILTGYPDLDDAVNSFRIGVLDYLKKGSDNLVYELRERVKKNLEKREEAEILALITQGESDELEFKASARWDLRANKHNKELEKAVVKTISGFLNSEKGGSLLLGVDDIGTVLGLEPDYQTFGRKSDRDEYENFLTSLLLNSCGKECSPLIQTVFHQIEDKEICRITVKPSPKPVFVKDEKGGENLFIRAGNSTRLLSTREAIEYCKIRWKT